MTNYHPKRRWKPDEVAEGVWIALGEETPDGIHETTQRHLVTLDHGTGRTRFKGPFTFDKIVIARRETGSPVDFLHNGHMTFAEDKTAEVTVTWTGPWSRP